MKFRNPIIAGALTLAIGLPLVPATATPRLPDGAAKGAIKAQRTTEPHRAHGQPGQAVRDDDERAERRDPAHKAHDDD